MRAFLARRHKVQGRGNRQFTFDVIHGERGVPFAPSHRAHPQLYPKFSRSDKPAALTRDIAFS